ncbi:hypothetical protein RAG37_14630 [Klebsiella pneumoniae]
MTCSPKKLRQRAARTRSSRKAGSDHLVLGSNRTYGLPVVVTNCSNNYGPYFLEKSRSC